VRLAHNQRHQRSVISAYKHISHQYEWQLGYNNDPDDHSLYLISQSELEILRTWYPESDNLFTLYNGEPRSEYGDDGVPDPAASSLPFATPTINISISHVHSVLSTPEIHPALSTPSSPSAGTTPSAGGHAGSLI
jgi:hypothetical protein